MDTSPPVPKLNKSAHVNLRMSVPEASWLLSFARFSADETVSGIMRKALRLYRADKLDAARK